MSDRIYAPWTEAQVAALNGFQRSGVMPPFTCGGVHELHQMLIAERDGWHCPDEDCGYRQEWAHSFMADPAPRFPGGAEHLALFEAARFYGSPMAAELAKTRELLRVTEQQLGEERQRTAELTARLNALQIHEAIQRIPQPAGPPCGETLYERAIADAGTIDRRLTASDPEPPMGTLVRDDCGLEWVNDGYRPCCWVRPDAEAHDPETWTKIAGNYGPVTVIEWGSSG